MTKLTDTQAALLSNAAARDDGSILPPPGTIKARGVTLDRVLKSLLKRGLVQETQGTDPNCIWRAADDGAPIALQVTAQGLDAIGLEPLEPAGEAPRQNQVRAAGQIEPAETSLQKEGPRPKGKLGNVLSAVERKAGATIEELVDCTGWQPHTTRAALTQLRKRGFPVVLATTGSRRAYRIAEKAG